MNKTKKFITAINKKLKLAHIEEMPEDSRTAPLRNFELKINPSPYFEGVHFNFKDAYNQLIENTVLEFYNDVPRFNNDGSIFWFDDKSVK